MTFEEVYQQIRKMHYEILDERESISKSARLSLSTWMLDILTEYRMAIEALEREPSDDLISRAEAIEAIENTDWYHQNRNKDMVSGANSDEHQAWYKAQDIYKALEAVPSADRPTDGDLISRQAAIDALYDKGSSMTAWGELLAMKWSDIQKCIEQLPSADRPRGEWVPCSERLPSEDGKYLVFYTSAIIGSGIEIMRYGEPLMPNVDVSGKHFYRSDGEWGDIVYDEVIAWMPLPEAYKESDTE